MIRKIAKSKTVKVFSVFLAINILAQIGFPTMAFGLTAGPTQPEVGSFQQINTSEMVNLFTGDFSYNLPLLTVPGPNGGYPINLVYDAQVGMEQEASWVGLGWNINPGAITRNLRGVPDDFNGDEIQKTIYQKPNRTVRVDATAGDLEEFFGADLKKLLKSMNLSAGVGVGLYYNNYSGVGTALSIGLSSASQDPSFVQGALSLDMDSRNGLSVTPSFSLGKHIRDGQGFDTQFNFNSREGLQKITLKYNYRKPSKTGAGMYDKKSRGAAIDFSGSTFVPPIDFPRKSSSFNFEAKLGLSAIGLSTDVTINASYNQSKLQENLFDFPTYGYLYAENDPDGQTITDFNREKEVPVSRYTPALPIPYATYDVFNVDGHGVSGSFRTFRSDAGTFTDPEFDVSNPFNVSLGGDVDFSAGETKVGVNAFNYSYSTAYSGRWTAGNEIASTNTFYTNVDDNLQEASYFKFLGESQAITFDNSSYPFNDNAYRSHLNLKTSGTSAFPVMRKQVEDNAGNISTVQSASSLKSTRDKRNKYISYLTRQELRNIGVEYSSDDEVSNYNYTGYDSHIGEITVINEEGMRYIYGLPVYNNTQKDVSFSVEHMENAGSPDELDRLTEYNAGTDNSSANTKGLSHSYTVTNTPPYAHSWMLTYLVSPDYVDLTGDGPSDDDLGYWVKYHYKNVGQTNWRVPFTEDDANLTIGAFTNGKDDQASYSYGTKEVVYLTKIETKTHVAIFTLNDSEANPRADGWGVVDENGGIITSSSTTRKLTRRLDKIELFKKNETTPIKTVHFEYNYSLCSGVANSISASGKLTLTKVYFTYLNNSKGINQPYNFTYNQIWNDDFSSVTTSNNPSYNPLYTNRWGGYEKYQPFTTSTDPSQHYPYCNQLSTYSYADRRAAATAWCLTEIELPSRAKIKVQYEQDDYAYVQNKKAMQMFKILGTGVKTGEDTYSANTSGDAGRVKVADNYIFFQLENTTITTDEINRMKESLENIYFKTYTKLKPAYGTIDMKSDYVEGYLDAEEVGVTSNVSGITGNVGYMKVEMVNPEGISKEMHPIRLAAITEIKFNRNDLVSGNNDLLSNVSSVAQLASGVPLILNLLKESLSLLSGYYNGAIAKGWGKHIDLSDDDFPSYIRLNSPDGKKVGGGNRVKAIAVTDAWDVLNSGSGYNESTYGQTYDYTIKEGGQTISSGVAEFEPMVGNEENPLRKPIRYRADKMLVKNSELYIEEPFNETLFPSPTVGYRKVIVKSLVQNDGINDVTKSRSGTVVHNFYTAKEYPVFVENTEPEHKQFNTPVAIPIPMVGFINYNNNGYSQGYSIELNNMHGMVKSVQTYHSAKDVLDDNNLPVTEVFYQYKTKDGYEENKYGGNQLENNVNTLVGDAAKSTQQIGKHVDTYVDMRESETNSYSAGLEPNLTMVVIVPVPNLWPTVDYSEATFRSVVTNKVITRNAILEKTIYKKDGAIVGEDENLLFDAETGIPLLTSTTNNFGNPVYTYNFPAHWSYEGMGGAYKNVGATVTNSASMVPGDVLLNTLTSDLYWVDGTVSSLSFIRDDNTSFTSLPTGPYKIIRSGRRNHVSTNLGYIESLSDPTSGRINPFINAFNSIAKTTPTDYGACPPNPNVLLADITFNDCYTGEEIRISHFGVHYTSNASCPLVKHKYALRADISCPNNQGGSETWIFFPTNISLIDPGSNFNVSNMTISVSGGQYYASDGVNTYPITIGNYIQNQTTGLFEKTFPLCFNECMDDVLNANSVTAWHEWDYDYTDVGLSSFNTTANANPYRYGKKGIWRTNETYGFDVDRKQSITPNISVDGTFENFTLFKWSPLKQDETANNSWTRSNTVSKYSPYGFELENIDAIGVSSSALYGYENCMSTAVASNTSYYELAYDGFEDYTSTYTGHGHLNFILNSTSGAPSLDNNNAHTGVTSLKVPVSDYVQYTSPTIGSSVYTNFTPESQETYHVSLWVKQKSSSSVATLTVLNNGSPLASCTTSVNNQKIEGWQRLELDFLTPSSNTIEIKIGASGDDVYLDDIRVQPFTSGMKTYVYQTDTYWLDAELDDRNYATFYSYDSEGKLVQIKKETKDGLRTIMSNRMNVHQK